MIGTALIVASVLAAGALETETSEVDPLLLFMSDSARTFGSVHQRSDIEVGESDGKRAAVRRSVKVDGAFAEANIGWTAPDFDIVLDGKVVHGETAAWNELMRIATDEGFGPGHEENWLRLLGRNETGTSNLDNPVLVNARSLMVCALICEFCESVPEIYAIRTRVQPGMDRTGFRFVIGLRKNRTGVSPALTLHRRLLENDEYRRAFADLVREACQRPGGEFSAESCARRVNRRRDELKRVCGGEIDCARLADGFESVVQFLTARSAGYVAKCSFAGLLQAEAPLAVDGEGKVLPAYGRYRGPVKLTLKDSDGKIYYSDNGCDPREEGGTLNPLATEYTAPFTVSGRCMLRARTLLRSGEWSALEMVNLNL